MVNVLLIAVGGGLGALLRFWVAGWAQRLTTGTFPVGTLVVNVLGCLLIGVVGAMLASAQSARPEVRSAIIIGLLGSFTTFSTYSGETLEMIQQRHLVSAGLNILLSNGLGLAGVWLGFRIVAPAG